MGHQENDIEIDFDAEEQQPVPPLVPVLAAAKSEEEDSSDGDASPPVSGPFEGVQLAPIPDLPLLKVTKGTITPTPTTPALATLKGIRQGEVSPLVHTLEIEHQGIVCKGVIREIASQQHSVTVTVTLCFTGLTLTQQQRAGGAKGGRQATYLMQS
jgi:hypothetical protein